MVACICSICQIVKINPFVFVPGSLVALESFEWVGWRAHGRCCGGPCADASEPSWKPCLWHAALRCSWEGGLEGGEIQLLVGWPWMHLKMHGFPSLTWPLKFESIQRCIDGKSLVPAWVTSFGICLLAGCGITTAGNNWGSKRCGTKCQGMMSSMTSVACAILCMVHMFIYLDTRLMAKYGPISCQSYSKLFLRGYHGQHVHHSHKHTVFCRGPVFVFWIFCGLDLMRLCSRCQIANQF